MRIAILGCGPSGLVAAHAAMQMKTDKIVRVYSRPVRSEVFGAQYLHQPIPKTLSGAAIEPAVIRYTMAGSPEAYLRKVYADKWDGHISDDLRDQAHIAWDLRATYDELWMRYSELIVDYDIPKFAIAEAINPLLDNHDLVINTIPRPALCLRRDHEFRSVEIWAIGESPDKPFPIECRDDVIQYNGDSSPSWYRASRIHGFSTVEWPGHMNRPPVPGVARVRKPLNHTCDCWTGQITHLGRMGRWQHGRLVHHVYADTMEQLLLKGAEIGVSV
jgi:hypothetical protein